MLSFESIEVGVVEDFLPVQMPSSRPMIEDWLVVSIFSLQLLVALVHTMIYRIIERVNIY
jgi:hypothetical protein